MPSNEPFLNVFRLVLSPDLGTNFIVKYGGQTLKMKLSDPGQTFGDVQMGAAQYFGLPPDIVFISDKAEKGLIYLRDHNLRDNLFPLQSARRTSYTPILYVIL